MPLLPVQAQELERGADIVVGTPGRLIAFLERAKVSASAGAWELGNLIYFLRWHAPRVWLAN